MAEMTIGQVARAAGVHVETIRYYQRIGLLAVPGRSAGSIRRYGEESVRRLAFVARARQAGFSLNEVRELLKLAEAPDCRGARAIAERKLAEVESRMADLRRVRSVLRGLVEQCRTGGRRSCPIIERLSRP